MERRNVWLIGILLIGILVASVAYVIANCGGDVSSAQVYANPPADVVEMVTEIAVDASAENTPRTYSVPAGDAERFRIQKAINRLDAQDDMRQWTIDRIATRFSESGDPGWIPEDVNRDGIIDVLDMIPIGQIPITGD